MSNKQTEEQQCLDGTADLAKALLDGLSTGVKISVVFVVVVVAFSFQSFRKWRKVRQLRLLRKFRLIQWLLAAWKFRNIQYTQ